MLVCLKRQKFDIVDQGFTLKGLKFFQRFYERKTMKYSERITYDVEKIICMPRGTAFFVKVIGDIQEFVFSHTILNVIEVRDTKDNDAVIVITAKDLLIVRRRSLRPLRLKGFHSRSISFFICDDWFVDSISFAGLRGINGARR